MGVLATSRTQLKEFLTQTYWKGVITVTKFCPPFIPFISSFYEKLKEECYSYRVIK